MSMLSFLSFTAFIVYMYVGITIYRDNRHIIEHKIFFALCLSLAVWSLSLAFIYPGQNMYIIEFLHKVSVIASYSFNAVLIHLILVLSRNKAIERIRGKVFVYTPFFILVLVRWIYFHRTDKDISLYNSFEFIQRLYCSICFFVFIIIGLRWLKKFTQQRRLKAVKVFILSDLLTLLLWISYAISGVSSKVNMLPNISHLIMILWIISIWYCFKKYNISNIQDLLKSNIIFDKLKDMILFLNCNCRIYSVNLELLRITGFVKKDIVGQTIDRFIEGLYIDSETINENGSQELVCQREYKLKTCGGELIPVTLSVTKVQDEDGQTAGAIVIAQDIRLVKKLEKEIEENIIVQKALSYLSYHDSLTGLLNRTSFEERMIQLENMYASQIGIIICDLDGLKLINDTLGHKDGDEIIKAAAQLVVNSINRSYLAARIGGDEFAIIIEDTSLEELDKIYLNIYKCVIEYNSKNPRLPLSMSIGYSLKDKGRTMKDVFKEADDNMYRKKLLQSCNTKETIVQALKKSLRTKDFLLQGHAERLYNLMYIMANAIGLPEYKLNNLWLMSQFHDIGKVGICDSILFKPGQLDLEEFSELKRHCEIGYRIAKSSPELEPVAEYILKHHEWWDGSGYPLELKGDEIPIECRMFSIVDAYDVMTSERPYKKPLKQSDAINEILRCAGSQFDPVLALKFVEVIRSKEKVRI